MNVTIDASVFVAAARPQETQHLTSRRLVQQVRRLKADLFLPFLILPECAAAIASPTGDAVLGEELVELVIGLPGLNLVHLDSTLASRAAQIAARHRLRGADSIYVAVAEAFDATLITWDTEMLERGADLVTTVYPCQWLADQDLLQSQI